MKRPIPRNRRRLVSVIRDAGDVIRIDDAAGTLAIDRTRAAKLLSRWSAQGWLRRVGPGAYTPASLDSLGSDLILDDPWVLVPALHAPAYVGGRTAAEHWDLTEQLFRDIVVLTAQPVGRRRQDRHGTLFSLHHINQTQIFGTRTVWRSRSKVLVSDPHRTVVDILHRPALGGGIQHVNQCLMAYLKRADRNDDTLIEYADRLGNGAVFKRLGFLVEQRTGTADLARQCAARLTKGNAKLDPALQCTRLITKWRLWVPAAWHPHCASSPGRRSCTVTVGNQRPPTHPATAGITARDPDIITREQILRRRDEILAIAESHGARDVRIFGSVARGDTTPASDLDLIVRFDPERTLLDHGGLIMDLRDLLGIKVDVISEAGMKDRFRRHVLKGAVPL